MVHRQAPALTKRAWAFRVWAAILVVGYGIGGFGLIVLVIGWFEGREGVAGPVTDLGYGALIGVIVTGGVFTQLRAAERKLAGVEQAALVVPALIVGSAIAADAQNLVPAAILAATLAILVAIHPARGEFLRQRASPSPTLLVIPAVGAIPLIVYALDTGADARDLVGPPHHVQRLSWMVALAVAIPLVGLLAALRASGWRISAWSAGAAVVVFGLASVIYPQDPGAVGRAWGTVAVAGGVVFIAVAERERHRAVRARAVASAE